MRHARKRVHARRLNPPGCGFRNWLRKNSSSVSFLRVLPNHKGSPVSRLHTAVRNLSVLPRYNSSTPICNRGAFRRLASQRSRHRTELSARPNRPATCRAAALSQACPTASSKRSLKGALLGNWATFSAQNPQRGHIPVPINPYRFQPAPRTASAPTLARVATQHAAKSTNAPCAPRQLATESRIDFKTKPHYAPLLSKDLTLNENQFQPVEPVPGLPLEYFSHILAEAMRIAK
jgi:hypothetical protein